jgi:hypothetical protein
MRCLPVLIGLAAVGCGESSPTPALHWFTTCGKAICLDAGVPGEDAGLPACTPAEQVGRACSDPATACDPQVGCDVALVCVASDPKQGGCPVSRMRFKKDIRYLSAADRAAVRDQLLSLPLATFRYRSAPDDSRLRLGFMIDGHESLACVDGDTVDLYGYASMAVAALQSQEQEIAQLRKELSELRRELRRR